MRKFKKVMALALSVAALCASTSAFAELEYNVEGLNGSYDKTANSLSLTVDAAAGDKTVLVLGEGVSAVNATGEDILYINQYADGEAAYTTMKLKGETALAAGTYAVKIGYYDANGDFAIAEGSIVVTEAEEEEQFVTIELWGDVNCDGAISVFDASAVVSAIVGEPEEADYIVGELVPGTEVIWGDVNCDGAISVFDASAIVSAIVGEPEDAEYIVGEPAQLPIVK